MLVNELGVCYSGYVERRRRALMGTFLPRGDPNSISQIHVVVPWLPSPDSIIPCRWSELLCLSKAGCYFVWINGWTYNAGRGSNGALTTGAGQVSEWQMFQINHIVNKSHFSLTSHTEALGLATPVGPSPGRGSNKLDMKYNLSMSSTATDCLF